MRFSDTFSLAFHTIKANRLRAGITISIIALGITALVGIMTAIEAMDNSIYENFTLLGANTFVIHYRAHDFLGDDGNDVKKTSRKNAEKVKKSQEGQVITFYQAKTFKDRFTFPAAVSIAQTGDFNATVFYGIHKTNPTVRVIGGDENYLYSSGYTLEVGRNFSPLDLETGRDVAILGMDVAKKIFGDAWRTAENSIIRVDGARYRVIGVLKAKGASSFLSLDNIVITTLNNVRRVYQGSSNTLNLSVTVRDIQQMDAAIGEATGIFRQVRGLSVTESDNFYIDRSDSLANQLKNLLLYVTIAAIFIGCITLIGSAIGLMNIMLVAVNERTREIGLVKSLGARRGTIRSQFLLESILISLFGASLGILLGMCVGNLFAVFLGTGFVVPWLWMFLGIVICSLTGLLAGLYPAIKAGGLDPIVALRYE
ncbi:ABC transporter permease [Dinghuibacter silviterrae]|uniref:Putative ABC transport system permease protein n=1 Tax=Dinghuibacter silviterrae TaxID=1539049 RepID=A0A4V3GLE4_9BACT|nr:ABC transporter permease [Dinghuibacter silviterrae]TDW99282.1 putative ABC transport system permease protein [Dinghuibacter silviterrae]